MHAHAVAPACIGRSAVAAPAPRERARPRWTTAHTLDQFAAPHLPRALVAGGALARLGELAARLPASLTRWLYLECRLAAGDAAADLAVNVERDAHDALLGRGAAPLDAGFTRHPAWSAVRELAARWADPASPLHQALESVWLEFDADAPEPGVPAVFADFLRAPPADATPAHHALPGAAALAALLGGALPRSTARAVRRCAEHLPAGAHLLYAGVMLSRVPAVVRLCVFGLAAGDVLPYLRAVGWPGAADEVSRVAARLARAGAPAPTVVHLDVGATGDAGGAAVGPRLGLEYGLSRREQRRGVVREVAVLDELVALGLCAPAKRDALLCWPGHERAVLAHELWPSDVLRRVNHLKVVCAPSGTEAKAYLCLHHEPAGAAGRRSAGSTR